MKTQTLVLTLAFVCIASTLAVPHTEEEIDYLFEKFLTQHGKIYSEEELEVRKSIFAESLMKVHHHNVHAKETGVELELNHMADWTPEEFDCMRGYQHKKNQGFLRQALSLTLDTTNLPDEVDWSTKPGVMTPVKNQGQCGSCWTFSATEAVESRYAIAKHQLYDLSEQELVACDQDADGHGCQGGFMNDAFEYIVEHGQCTEKSFPYISGEGTTNGTCIECTPVVHISGYQNVQVNSEEQLMAAVAQGPVAVAVNAGSNQKTSNLWQYYSGGVLTGYCPGGDMNLDHGVLLVGYGTDAETGTQYWKIRNSWTAQWGEEGYIRIARGAGYGESGQCGILGSASYPVV